MNGMVEGNVGAEPLAARTGSLAGIRRVLEQCMQTCLQREPVH